MKENVNYNPEGWYYHNPLKQDDKVDKDPGEGKKEKEECNCRNRVVNPKDMEETPIHNGTLCNRDISHYYKNTDFYLSKKDFTCAFTYWIISQSPYDTPDISEALKAFDEYMDLFFKDVSIGFRKFSYKAIQSIVNSEIFEFISEIEKLNHPKIDTGQDIMFSSRYDSINPDYDFIDLDALARNVMFMIMREYITQR